MGIKHNIAIIQKIIPHYRRDFFEKLCNNNLNVEILHSSKISKDNLVDRVSFPFPNINVPCFKLGRIYFQPIISIGLSNKYKIIVMGLELSSLSNILIWLFSIISRKRIIWWTHGFNLNLQKTGLFFWIDRKVKTLLMKFSYKILLYTDYGLKELIKNGIEKNKIIILGNALDESIYRKALKEINLDEEIKKIEIETKKSFHTITYLGRLTKAKKPLLILEITKKLINNFPDLRVFIIGDGEEKENLKKQINLMQFQKYIYLIGSINDPKKLAPYMTLTDFIVIPERVGLSIVHSMIYGIPFITLKNIYHGPEIAYLESGKNGYLANNIDDLVNWVIDVWNSSEKYNELKRNCISTIEKKVNIKSMVENFLNAIN